MDLTLTGRWVEAAEALALGLLNQVCEDPEPVAAGIAASLAGRGSGVFGIKTVMVAGGLLDRMRAERTANRAAWARVLGRREPKGRVGVWTDERGACDERGGKTPTAGARRRAGLAEP